MAIRTNRAVDIQRLTDATEGLKGYVDRYIAHAQSEAVPKAVTLKVLDLHDAIDVIGEVFGRYYSLFTAATLVELTPVIQHDWKAIFRKLWDRQALS